MFYKVNSTLASGEIKWRSINHKCIEFLKTLELVINNNIIKKSDDHDHESIKDEIGNTTTTMCYHRGQTQSNRRLRYLH